MNVQIPVARWHAAALAVYFRIVGKPGSPRIYLVELAGRSSKAMDDAEKTQRRRGDSLELSREETDHHVRTSMDTGIKGPFDWVEADFVDVLREQRP